jgi:hypothetical protein
MDRSWRRRSLPQHTNEKGVTQILANADSIELLPDGTLVLAGKSRDGKITGRWCQAYLPATRQAQPPPHQLDQIASGTGRYDHPWRFYAEDVFRRMREKYTFFGVNEPVESRVQFYRTEKPSHAGDRAAVDAADAVWRVKSTHFMTAGVHRHRLDWDAPLTPSAVLNAAQGPFPLSAVSAALGGGYWNLHQLAILTNAFTARSLARYVKPVESPSLYNAGVPVRFRDVPDFGGILMFADKRDDKLVAGVWSDVVELVQIEPPTTAVARAHVGARQYRNARDPNLPGVDREMTMIVSPPRIGRASISVRARDGHVSEVIITFAIAGPPRHPPTGYKTIDEWMAVHVMHVRIGTADGTLLFDALRTSTFQRTTAPESGDLVYETNPPVPLSRRTLVKTLSEAGEIGEGTCLWFVGATGLAATAEVLEWRTH